MTNLDRVLKSRNITDKAMFVCFFPLVKAVVFPVVIIKKAENQRTDAFELWCWRRLESLGLQGDQIS